VCPHSRWAELGAAVLEWQGAFFGKISGFALSGILRSSELVGCRVGLIANWFNRGQASVARHLRSIFDDLGCRTFVLARPPKDSFHLGSIVSDSDIWNAPNVTRGSGFNMSADEYIQWARTNALDVVFTDQNYQFEELAKLKNSGVAVVSRFVWEAFAEEHVSGALRATDLVYSITESEQKQYASYGMKTPRVRWGCHPEFDRFAEYPKRSKFTFFYPGGFLSLRKPTGEVIEAFHRAGFSDAELIIKTQRPMRRRDLQVPSSWHQALQWRKDPFMDSDAALAETEALGSNIEVISDDLPFQELMALMASCHVLVAPSRWEGLGLHVYEAASLAVPCVFNDMPPLNERANERPGALFASSSVWGKRKNGLDVHNVDLDCLASCLREAQQHYGRLKYGAIETKRLWGWERTKADVAGLLVSVRRGAR